MKKVFLHWRSSLAVVLLAVVAFLSINAIDSRRAFADGVDPDTAEAVINDTDYYETLKEAIVAAASGDTVKVLQDVTFTASTDGVFNATCTLDLNGKTVTSTTTNSNVLRVNSGCTLTLCDTSEAQTGTIDGNAANRAFYVNGGHLVMNSGIIQNCKRTNASGGSVSVDTNGSFVMNGGTITGGRVYQAYKSSGETSYYGGNVNMSSGTFTMTGGTITEGECWCSGGNVYITGDVTMTMSGGTISKGQAGLVAGGDTANSSHKVTGYGGNVYVYYSSSKKTVAKFIMTGGTLTEGCSVNGSGGNLRVDGEGDISGDAVISYGIATSGGNIFVNIGSVDFEKGILKIHGNATILNGRTQSSAGTLDTGSGQNITINGSASSTDTSKQYAPAKVTIYENAKVTFDENCTWTTSGNGGNISNLGQLIIQGNAEISNGKTSGNGGNIYFGGYPAKTGYENFVHIEGGTIKDGEAKIGGNIYGGQTATNEIVISGGTISGGWASNTDASKGGNCYFATITVKMTGGEIKDGMTGSTKNSGQVASNVQLYSETGTYYFLGGHIYGRFDATKKYGSLVLGGSIQIYAGTKTGLYRTNANGYLQNITIWPFDDDALIYIQQHTQATPYTNADSTVVDSTLFATLGTNEDGVKATNRVLQHFKFVDSAAGKSFVPQDDDEDGVREALHLAEGHQACVCGAALEDGKTYGSGEEAVTHICNYVTWTEWTSTNSLPTVEDFAAPGNGYYYLASNVSLTGKYTPAMSDSTAEAAKDQVLESMEGYQLYLDLNGMTINTNSTNRFIAGFWYIEGDDYYYTSDIFVSICDSQLTGKIKQPSSQKFKTQQGQFIFLYGENCQLDIYGGEFLANNAVCAGAASIYLAQNSVFNLYGGRIEALAPNTANSDAVKKSGGTVFLTSGAKFNMYGGELDGAAKNKGGAIYAEGSETEVNIFDGTIYGGDSRPTSTLAFANGYGGSIYIKQGTLSIYGGTISGGKGKIGGNLYIDSSAKAYIYGGTIEDGEANSYGGNIAVNSSTAKLIMTGGTVKNGNAIIYAGNLAVASSGSADIVGGEICGGTVTGSDSGSDLRGGGNIGVASGVLRLMGGMIQDGVSYNDDTPNGVTSYGGNIYANAGTIELYGSGSEVTLLDDTAVTTTGITIQNGITKGSGGNIALSGKPNTTTTESTCRLYIYGGTITGGITGSSSEYFGGNIYLNSTNTTMMSGGTITRGNRVNVYVAESATFEMTGGEIHDGAGPNGFNLHVDGTATIGGTAEISGNALSCGNNSISAQEATGSITFNAGTFDGRVQAVSGQITINGGTFDEVESRYQTSSVTITAGTFNTFVRTGNSNGKGTLTISGGVFHGAVSKTDSGTITITGGWFENTPAKTDAATDEGGIVISGGYYVSEPAEALLADEFVAYAEENTNESITYHYVVDRSCTITTSSSAAEGMLTYVATLSGGDCYRRGTSVTVTASDSVGTEYSFKGWYLDGELLSANKIATFDAATSSNLVAVYEYGGANVDFTVSISSDAANFKVKTEDGEYGSLVDSFSATNVKAGTVYTVCYEGDEDFIAWANGNQKFMTQSEEYTFTVGSDVTLTAIYTDTEATKKVVFLSTNYQLLKTVEWQDGTSSLADVKPTTPVRVGKTFVGWYIGSELATDDMINDSTENYISVYPKYTVDEENTYTVYVKKVTVADENFSEWSVASDLFSKTQAVADVAEISVEAEADDLHFICFKVSENGSILSYSTSFVFHAVANTTIYAVYGPSEVAQVPTVTMTYANVINTTGATFEVTRSIPEGYTLIEQGILITSNKLISDITLETAKAALTTDSTTCKKYVSSGMRANAITILNIARLGTSSVYARGYVIYEKDGVIGVIYSNVAYGTTEGITVE